MWFVPLYQFYGKMNCHYKKKYKGVYNIRVSNLKDDLKVVAAAERKII